MVSKVSTVLVYLSAAFLLQVTKFYSVVGLTASSVISYQLIIYNGGDEYALASGCRWALVNDEAQRDRDTHLALLLDAFWLTFVTFYKVCL